MLITNIFYYTYYLLTTVFTLCTFTYFYKFLYSSVKNQSLLAIVYFSILSLFYLILTPRILLSFGSIIFIIILYASNFMNFEIITQMNNLNDNPIIKNVFMLLNLFTNVLFELFTPIYTTFGIKDLDIESISSNLFNKFMFNNDNNITNMLSNMINLLGNETNNNKPKKILKKRKQHEKSLTSNDEQSSESSDSSSSSESEDLNKYKKKEHKLKNRNKKKEDSLTNTSEIASLDDIFSKNHEIRKIEKMLDKRIHTS